MNQCNRDFVLHKATSLIDQSINSTTFNSRSPFPPYCAKLQKQAQNQRAFLYSANLFASENFQKKEHTTKHNKHYQKTHLFNFPALFLPPPSLKKCSSTSSTLTFISFSELKNSSDTNYEKGDILISKKDHG